MIGSTVFAYTIWMLISAPGTCFQRTVAEASSAPLRLGGLPLTRFSRRSLALPLQTRNLLPRVFIVFNRIIKKTCVMRMPSKHDSIQGDQLVPAI